MPMKDRPMPMMRPNVALIPSCGQRKKRLSRRAASSIATVVRCRSFEPNRRIRRSRKSSRCSSTKIATTKMIPAVASELRMGDRICFVSSSGAGGGCCTWTGIAAGSWFVWAGWLAFGAGVEVAWEPGLSASCSMLRSNVSQSSRPRRTVFTFCWIIVSYRGASPTRSASGSPSACRGQGRSPMQ